MSITKHYCDYCDKEFNPDRKYSLKAEFEQPEGWPTGDVTKVYEGEFCSRSCAIRFMEMDGEKAIKVE